MQTVENEPQYYKIVGSSNISALSYLPEQKVAAVTFHKNGIETSTYWYYNVPYEIFEQWVNAESQGKFLFTHIKGNYHYQRVK